MKYYNYNRLIHLKDRNGKTPSVFLVTNNRTAGKTTGVLKLCLDDYFKKGRTFVLLFRNMYEIKSTHLLFEDVCEIYFENLEIQSVSEADGLFYRLVIQGDKTIGFALCLKKSDNLKKYSAVFRNVFNIVFDEYQLESRDYIKDEVMKLESLLITISRGKGELVRYTRLFLLGNPYDNINPYYFKWNIWRRLQPNTRVLRGDGWVGDFTLNEEASKAIGESAHSHAFNSDYTAYAKNASYLHDQRDFVENIKGHFIPLFQLSYEGNYATVGKTKNKIHVKEEERKLDYELFAFSTDRVDEDTKVIKKTKPLYKTLLTSYQAHKISFNSLRAKEIFIANIVENYH